MFDLGDVITQTDKIFSNGELSLPEPSADWQKRLAAFADAEWEEQHDELLLDMRIEQAKKLGFQKITNSERVEMLMGEERTDDKEGKLRHKTDWIYNHHDDEVLTVEGHNWGSKCHEYWRIQKIGPFFKPPFLPVEVWRIQSGKLPYLKEEVPREVALRILRVKELDLFNAFEVIGPMEMWKDNDDDDDDEKVGAIITAELWLLPKNDKKDDRANAGRTAHFFLAHWK